MKLKHKIVDIEQKQIGVILIIVGILSIIFLKVGTAALLIIPMGIYALVTKNNILS